MSKILSFQHAISIVIRGIFYAQFGLSSESSVYFKFTAPPVEISHVQAVRHHTRPVTAAEEGGPGVVSL